MKLGYKHKTGSFGTDAENYASRLFMMLKNPNGSRRPDLISPPGQFTPSLTIELKSGRNLKGVLIDYQLHYAITTFDDYVELLGEKPLKKEEALPGMEDVVGLISRKGEVAYYYGLINRVDEIMAKDLDKPFSTVKLNWGDIYLIPHEVGFFAFAISRHMRTGEAVEEIVEELKDLIKRDVHEGISHYEERKGSRQSWQDIYARDMRAIFYDDMDIATRDGHRRIELLWEYFPALATLSKVEIPGPNKTKIYVLSEQKHEDLFDRQLKEIVEQRAPVLENLHKQRKRARSLLDKISFSDKGLFSNGMLDYTKNPALLNDLSGEQINRLERLTNWLGKDEEALTPLNFIINEEINEDVPF